MAESTLLVTCPMLSARRRVIVDQDSVPPRAVRTETHWIAGAVGVAKAARLAGASVTWLSLVEADLEASVRAELEGAGVRCEFVRVGAATQVVTEYVDGGGNELFQVSEDRTPSVSDVDHLLDRLEKLLQRGVSFVVVAGDLVGAPRVDYMERVVGRAWGHGVKTICVEAGAAIKQAFHTNPFAALVPEAELIKVCPPAAGVTQDDAQTLARVFEDAVRLVVVTREDGTAYAATRTETRPLGVLNGLNPSELMGAVAARLVVAGDDYLGAVTEGMDVLRAE